ncbi:hypothetical protein Patl1_15784 [Pistacia atlantica]|uniref:Uncharacterized protein n=1 Tax=Pistacia atlantica TaxID=434234 RepID=A0ACC1B762_9ROSI|nr:hypothetical protein Patl1_15784 [Pistacia atlantica]
MLFRNLPLLLIFHVNVNLFHEDCNDYHSLLKFSDPYLYLFFLLMQTFVTHRVVVRATDQNCAINESRGCSIYLLEWLLPPLKSFDKFTVGEAGVIVAL